MRLQRDRVVARQITQVGSWRHQQAVQATGTDRLNGALQAALQISCVRGRHACETTPVSRPLMLLDTASLYFRAFYGSRSAHQGHRSPTNAGPVV